MAEGVLGIEELVAGPSEGEEVGANLLEGGLQGWVAGR